MLNYPLGLNGALGDLIIMTPLLRRLKEDGYHVTVCVKPYAAKVLLNNPNVDELIKDDPPNDGTLEAHWEAMGKGFDKVVNLSGSLEGNLMPTPGSPSYNAPKAFVHESCNRNFYDETMKWGGYPEEKGHNGELFFSKSEEKKVKKWRKHHKKKFVVLWSLSGSSIHKAYPFTHYVITALALKYPDMLFVTTGDELCKILESDLKDHPQVIRRSGGNVRNAFILTKYADCVVGTDTGVMHASGCFDTPKVILMSANTKENISKYWKNCQTLHSGAPCYPCHKLIYDARGCNLDKELHIPVCMSKLEPKAVFKAVERVYKEKIYGSF